MQIKPRATSPTQRHPYITTEQLQFTAEAYSHGKAFSAIGGGSALLDKLGYKRWQFEYLRRNSLRLGSFRFKGVNWASSIS